MQFQRVNNKLYFLFLLRNKKESISLEGNCYFLGNNKEVQNQIFNKQIQLLEIKTTSDAQKMSKYLDQIY